MRPFLLAQLLGACTLADALPRLETLRARHAARLDALPVERLEQALQVQLELADEISRLRRVVQARGESKKRDRTSSRRRGRYLP